EHDVDAAGQVAVHLEHLADVAVLPVGSLRAGVPQLERVLVDPLPRRLEGGHELLRAYHVDHVGRSPGVGGELAAGRGGDNEDAVPGDRVDAAGRVVRLAADAL